MTRARASWLSISRDPSFEEALLLTRRVVLGVLAQVPVFARFADRADDPRALHAAQAVQLAAEPLRSGGGDWRAIVHGGMTAAVS